VCVCVCVCMVTEKAKGYIYDDDDEIARLCMATNRSMNQSIARAGPV
jgi:hypothetical protein